VQAVDQVAAVVEENTASAEEMGAGSDHVAGVIAEVARVARENAGRTEAVLASAKEVAGHTEGVAAATAQLQAVADGLLAGVRHFRI
jgi:methyl-accepting chemotaxis protein